MNNVTFGGFAINILDILDTTIPALIIFLLGAVLIAGMAYYYVRRRKFTSASIKY